MEHSVFRDYCKAENSEDEEVNCDLQSRLYAEVYYASNNLESIHTKKNIKIEAPVKNAELYKTKSTSKSSNPNDNSTKNNSGRNQSKIYQTKDLTDNSMLIDKDDKSKLISLCVSNEITLIQTDDKRNLNIPCVENLQHSQTSIESSKSNELTACNQSDNTYSNLHPHNAYNTSKDIIKPETEIENKEHLKSMQNLNSELNTSTNQSVCVNSTKSNVDNNVEKNQEPVHTKQDINDNPENILKKYEFSKLFINKLYLEKYENLTKRLEQLEEEPIEQQEINVEETEENQQQLDTHVSSADQTEIDTRYDILSTNEKLQKTRTNSDEVTVLCSDTDSESEESILEVPIPPKPQPPVIQLPDSDDGTDMSDSNTDEECLFIIDNVGSIKKKEKITYRSDKSSDTNLARTTTINDTSKSGVTEDIMLNCTGVQKSVSSIKEIIEMRKNVQNELEQCSSKDRNILNEKEKFVIVNEVRYQNPNAINKSLSSVTKKDNVSESQLLLETSNNSNVVYERDKQKSVTFADDVVAPFCNSNEFSSSRKRRCESDGEQCTNAKQMKSTEGSSNQSQNKNKQKEETWEEYFFRPMSDNLKTFYNKPQGQENLDIWEIQSKMSNEDLMPNVSKKRRFWNIKCKKCQCEGHAAYNCPQPYKPLRCHMCGTQGHTETRCPQKMCLTCGKKQGTFRKTCESCRTLYCNMCKAIGHKSTECPDLWRRFHQTTRNSEINVPENLSEIMKPADLLYCCNCTKRGHDSSTCYEYRWSQHFPTPAFVSNYGNRTQCSDIVFVDTNEDIIPLNRKKSCGRLKNVVFNSVVTNDDFDGCCVLYSFGAFQSKKQNGEQIIKKVALNNVTEVENFIKNRISVPVFEQLIKAVKFEFKIFYNPQKVLMTRTRSLMGVSLYVNKLFNYWLKLKDDEKDIKINTNLPRSTKKLVKLLATKLQQLDQNLQDPKSLCSQIDTLKATMFGTQDSSTLSKLSEKLLELQQQLLYVYYTKPKTKVEVSKLRKTIQKLTKKSSDSSPQKLPEVSIPLYVQIIVMYNKVFIPRSLTDEELNKLLRDYYKVKKTGKNKGKENKAEKRSSPHETFVHTLPGCSNWTTNIEDKQTSNTIHQPNVTQKDKETPTATSTAVTCFSTSNSIQPDHNVASFNIENVRTERYNPDGSVAEYNHIYPIEVVQLPRNYMVSSNYIIPSNEPVGNPIQIFQEPSISFEPVRTEPNFIPLPSNYMIPSNEPVENPITIFKKPSISVRTESNLISLPLKKSTCSKEKTSKDNVEKHVQIVQNSSEPINKPNTQQTVDAVQSATNITKKKKNKKAKKTKLSLESNLQLAENKETSVDVFIESKAKQTIIEALQFNLPYMNKAVEEVEKRINDKTIKHENIEMLQRLINLEKSHQEYVSSFCNYLQ
ncbi:uncharacterized protein LOC122400442 isoform X2 [Colletes gigas]|uniref:uncharacterized protein LOC122400442 isoform X2 n=1 Tax=Colletes gigas TaxID=935657 RepID=UPI001C9A6660|nr:uncharacterized protein LOC122400442 isoform X2 [Colletes gigas]